MSYITMFEDSQDFHPNGGVKFSPAECGFILAEMEGLVEKYVDEKPTGNHIHDRMVAAHLEALRYITDKFSAGMTNKPDAQKI